MGTDRAGWYSFDLDQQVDGSTRLLVRSASAAGPRPLSDMMDLLFWHPAHVLMQHRELREIKRRAERQVGGRMVRERCHEVAAAIS